MTTAQPVGPLPERRATAKATVMGRILTVMLILCLAFSHGRMSADVPHADGSDHHAFELTQMIDLDHADGLAADRADEDKPDASPGDESGKNAGHHVHSAGDGLTFNSHALPDRIFKESTGLPTDDPALRLIALDPLSEPPSA